MTIHKTTVVAAISAAIASIGCATTAGQPIAAVGQPMHPEKPTYAYEKCYGVARAGQNDCFTASNSCAGTVVEAGRKDAWIYVPDGNCNKIIGGSLEPNRG